MGFGGENCLGRESAQTTSQYLHRWKTCEIYAAWGDVGTCLRQAASSHAFDSDQPKTTGGADSSSGWQWVDGVRWLHRKWGWKSARGKWEGGWDPGGCTWHVESTRRARHAADWRRHKFKTRPPPQLLPPTTFQNNCVTLTQNNL